MTDDRGAIDRNDRGRTTEDRNTHQTKIASPGCERKQQARERVFAGEAGSDVAKFVGSALSFLWGSKVKRKKILFGALGLFVVCGIALGAALLSINRLIAANRSLILARVQRVFERKVEVREIRASLWPAVGIALKGISVADDPEFSRDLFFGAEELVLKLKLAPLWSRRIEVDRFLLTKPRLRVIRNPEGRFNFASLGKKEKVPKEEKEKRGTPGIGAALPREAADVDIRDAEVLFEDRLQKSPKTLTLQKVSLRLKGGGNPSTVGISLSLGLFQPVPNLMLSGDIRVPSDGREFDPGRLGLDLELEAKNFRLDFLRDSVSDLKSLLPPDLEVKGPVDFRISAKGDWSRLAVQGNLAGKESAVRYGDRFQKPEGVPLLLKWEALRQPREIELRHGEITAGEAEFKLKGSYTIGQDPARRTVVYTLESPLLPLALFRPRSKKGDGFTALSASGKMEVGGTHVVSVQARKAKLEGIDFTPLRAAVRITGKEIAIRNLEAGLYDGTVRGNATQTAQGASAPFGLDLKLAGVDLSKLLSAAVEANRWKISGKLDTSLKLAGRGRTWKEVEESLAGKGTAEIKEGTIQDFNLLETVMSKTTGFVALSESLAKKTKPKYRHLFESKDTSFEKLKLDYGVSGGKILADELFIQSPDYAMKAKGWIGFDREASLQATLFMSQGFSADMVADHKSASFFTDSEGQLFVPVKLTGVLPRLKPEIDPAYFSKVAEKALLQRALDRARKKARKTEEGQEKTDEAIAPRKKERPEREFLRRALEGLLERQSDKPAEPK